MLAGSLPSGLNKLLVRLPAVVDQLYKASALYRSAILDSSD